MLTDFQRKKHTAVFEIFDVDKNGYVDRSDFDVVVNNLAEMRSVARGSADYTRLSDIWVAVWNGLREVADTNRDQLLVVGKVSRLR